MKKSEKRKITYLKSYYEAWPEDVVAQIDSALEYYKKRNKYVEFGMTTDLNQQYDIHKRIDSICWTRMSVKFRTNNYMQAEELYKKISKSVDWTGDTVDFPDTIFDERKCYYFYFLIGRRMKSKKEKLTKKYTFIDLFAGCGGLSEGFLTTERYEALAHVEWEKPMVNTLRHRLFQRWEHSECEAKQRVVRFDIQKTDELINGNWSEESKTQYGSDNGQLIQEKGLKGIIGNQHVNLIIGGPPCQAYSIHGRATDKNSMQDDYRNYLFESFCKVVDEFKPDAFVFENVAGLLSAKPGGIPVRERIYKEFTNIGYIIRKPEDMPTALYNVVNFEVPQSRPRIIILGVKKDGILSLDELYASISGQQSSKELNVHDAIYDLPRLYPLDEPINIGRTKRSHQLNPNPDIIQHEARNHGPRERQIFREWVENNMNHWSHKDMIDYYYKKTGHHTLYQKYKSLEWDKPSHTVVAHLSKDGYMFIHPDAEQERSITVREAACLMTFPRDFEFEGSTAMNYKMIGNAVPVRFAEAIATGIYKILDKKNIE